MFGLKKVFWFFSIMLLALASACSNESELPSVSDLPDIVGVYPGDGSANIPTDTDVYVTFSNAASALSIIPSGSNGVCAGTIQVSDDDFLGCVDVSAPVSSDNNKTFTVKPKHGLDLKSVYKIRIVLLAKNSLGDPTADQRYESPNGFSTSYQEGPPNPGSFGLITVNDPSSDSVRLTWRVASDSSDDASALSYKLVKSTSDNIHTVAQAESNGALVMDWTDNITDSGKLGGLTSCVDYYFNVLVKDSDGNIAAYKRVKFRALDNVQPVPGNSGTLTVDDLSSDRVTLSWAAAADNLDDTADLNYKVVRSLSNNIGSVTQAEGGSLVKDWTPDLTGVDATGLNSSTKYYFNVLVKDAAGNKSAYTTKDATTLDIDHPNPGDGNSLLTVNGRSVTATSLTISWNFASDTIDNASLLKYKVVYAATSDHIDTVAEADNTSDANVKVPPGCGWRTNVSDCNVTGLTTATRYSFNALVKDTAGNIAIYTFVSAITLDNLPPTSDNYVLSYEALAANSVKVKWNVATDNLDDGLIRYKLYKSESDNIRDASNALNNGTLVKDSTTDLSADVSGLDSSKRYYFNALAIDGSENHKAYTSSSILTKDNLPPLPGKNKKITVETLGANTARLSWPAASDNSDDGKITYQVVESTNDNLNATSDAINKGTPRTAWISDISVDIAGLQSAKLYYFNVIAKDGTENKSIYDATSATTLDNILPVPGNSGDITVDAITHNSLKLKWTAATDNSDDSQLRYRVVRSDINNIDSTSGALSGILVKDWSSDLSADVSDLTVDQICYFNVLVKDVAQNKSVYDVTSATPVDTGGPSPVSMDISYKDLSTDSVALFWAKASDNQDPTADLKYKLVKASSRSAIDELTEVAGMSGDGVVMDLSVDTTSATASGLTADTTYYFNVMVQDTRNNNTIYTVMSVKTHDNNPPKPGSGLTVESLGGTSAGLSWGKADDSVDLTADLFYLLGKSDSPMSSTADVETNSVTGWIKDMTSKDVSGLTPSTLYYFDALAKNSRGQKARYGSISRTTKAAAWPDSNFDGDGMATLDVSSGSNDQVKAMVVNSDGTILLAGKVLNGGGSYSLVVSRYKADGSLDATFDVDGIATDSSGDGFAIITDSHGRILIAGAVKNGPHTDLAIWRYLPDGSMDDTFDGAASGNGRVTYDEDGSMDAATNIAVDSQGRILAAGYVTSGENKELAVFRFLDNGNLDNDFDADGYATYNGGHNDDQASAMIPDHKDRPIIVGYSHNGANKDMLLLRYTVDGSPDISFSGDGVVTHDIVGRNDEAFDVKLDSQGKILIAGRSQNNDVNYDMVIWRYLPNGALDTAAFKSSDGFLTHHNAGGGAEDDVGYGLSIDNQNLILVAGSSRNSAGNLDMTLWRYKLNGDPDIVFNDPKGHFYNDYGSGKDDEGYSVFVDSQGKIIISGYLVNASGNKDLAVWRLTAPDNPDDTVAPSPGGGGVITPSSIGSSALTLSWVAASDSVDPPLDLRYKIFNSTSDNISTVAETLLYGNDLTTDWKSATTFNVSDLSSDTTYYFNVLTKDTQNNMTAYDVTSATTLSPPEPGNSGNFTVTNNNSSSRLNLSWTIASDDTGSSTLQYKVVSSTLNNIGTINDASANGTVVMDWTTNVLSEIASNLEPLTTYYFNVLVKDASNAESIYNTASGATLSRFYMGPMDIGYDRAGGDYHSSAIPSAEACRDACGGDENCVAWSYDNGDSTCYLKNAAPAQSSNASFTSGVKLLR